LRRMKGASRSGSMASVSPRSRSVRTTTTSASRRRGRNGVR
jgi:hypothetical protein